MLFEYVKAQFVNNNTKFKKCKYKYLHFFCAKVIKIEIFIFLQDKYILKNSFKFILFKMLNDKYKQSIQNIFCIKKPI